MPILIILRGNSGSGKTTLAKALQKHFGSNTMRLSHDMVRMEILHTWSREGVEKSLPLMQELLKYGRQHSEITVMEGILPSDAYRLKRRWRSSGTAFSPITTIFPLKKPFAGTAQNQTGEISGKTKCAAGGVRRI